MATQLWPDFLAHVGRAEENASIRVNGRTAYFTLNEARTVTMTSFSWLEVS